MADIIRLARVDSQQIYEDLRLIVLAKIDEPGGGYAALGALATLLGEFLKYVPADIREELKAEAYELVQKTLDGQPLLVMRH